MREIQVVCEKCGEAVISLKELVRLVSAQAKIEACGGAIHAIAQTEGEADAEEVERDVEAMCVGLEGTDPE